MFSGMEVNTYPISTVSRKAGNKFLSYIPNAKRYIFYWCFLCENMNAFIWWDKKWNIQKFDSNFGINIECAWVANIHEFKRVELRVQCAWKNTINRMIMRRIEYFNESKTWHKSHANTQIRKYLAFIILISISNTLYFANSNIRLT